MDFLQREKAICDEVISLKKIPETSWAIVLTNKQHEFFYDYEQKRSTWSLPHQILNVVGELLAASMDMDLEEEFEEDEEIEEEEFDGEEEEEIEEEEPPHKLSDKRKADDSETHVEATKKIKAEEPSLSQEERIHLFQTMLSEFKPSPFASWDSEQLKMSNDDRFHLISNSKERHMLFNKYCTSNAQLAAVTISSSAKQAKEAYLQLLEAETNFRTRYADFARKFQRDRRFSNFSNLREREALFSAHIDRLKELAAKKKKMEAANAKSEFIEMLQEIPNLNSSMLWKDITRAFEHDKRFKAVQSPKDRETWFNVLVSSIKDSASLDDQASLSLKKREEEVRLEKAANTAKAESQLSYIKRDEAETQFKTLLTELVKSHANPSFNDWENKLKHDHRYQTQLLTLKVKKELFLQHIERIYQKRLADFHSLLHSISDLTSSFNDVASSILSDPRATRMEMSESELEQLFDEYQSTRIVNAESEFNNELKHSSFIEFHVRQAVQKAGADAVDKGLKTPNFGDEKKYISLSDTKKVLTSLNAYTMLDPLPERRDELIMQHFDDLSHRILLEKGGTHEINQ